MIDPQYKYKKNQWISNDLSNYDESKQGIETSNKAGQSLHMEEGAVGRRGGHSFGKAIAWLNIKIELCLSQSVFCS